MATQQDTTERQIVESIDIAASPDCVFRALTEPEALLAWWGDPTSYPATHWEMDLRPGGKWLSRWKDLAAGTEFELGGEVLEIRAPHLLVVSWWDDRYPGLEPRSSDTRSSRSLAARAACA
jgi:uncharacterized protein YndB with AHSA1/START domain